MKETHPVVNIPLFGSTAQVLTVLFVLLKVFGKITWSWWVVFAPLWAPVLILCVILAVCLGLALLSAFIN